MPDASEFGTRWCCECNDFCTSETAQFMLTAEEAEVAAVTFDTFNLQANEIRSEAVRVDAKSKTIE